MNIFNLITEGMTSWKAVLLTFPFEPRKYKTDTDAMMIIRACFTDFISEIGHNIWPISYVNQLIGTGTSKTKTNETLSL